MPGITFEIIGERKIVSFDEKIHGYLLKQESKDKHQFALLLDLDPYGDRIFLDNEIQKLVVICDELYLKYNEEFNWEHNRVRKFSKNFKQLCLKALREQKHIQALGE
jgi:hypothetical protein